MRLNEVSFDSGPPIDGYGPGFFRVDGERIDGAALVLPGAAGPWGGFDELEPLLALAGRIDVLLVGTGDAIAPIPDGMRAALEEAGMGVEVMGSAPACRTYNVLLAEGRRIGAALIPVSG